MPRGVYARTARPRYGEPGIKGPGPDKRVRRSFERYAAKAPVNYPGPQKSAAEAYEDIKYLLTPEEQTRLSTARWHAVGVGGTEGRAEFDLVCATIRKRLFGA